MYECSACTFGVFVFFKQKTAYEVRISDWSSDVCSSDLRLQFCASLRRKCFQWRLGSHCRCRPVNGWSDLALAGCGLGFRTALGFGGPTHLFTRPAGYLSSEVHPSNSSHLCADRIPASACTKRHIIITETVNILL